jgi:putative ABC transport system permease protein
MMMSGLVSIPGMMTGQILGGTPPHEAAHYQMM